MVPGKLLLKAGYIPPNKPSTGIVSLAVAAADSLLSFASCLDGRRLKVLFVVVKCVKLIIFIILLLFYY